MAVHRRRPGLAMLALATVLTVPLALLPIARAVAFEPGCACEPVVASPVPGIEVLLEEHLDLLRGKQKGRYGQAHRGAIVLGLKPEPATRH